VLFFQPPLSAASSPKLAAPERLGEVPRSRDALVQPRGLPSQEPPRSPQRVAQASRLPYRRRLRLPPPRFRQRPKNRTPCPEIRREPNQNAKIASSRSVSPEITHSRTLSPEIRPRRRPQIENQFSFGSRGRPRPELPLARHLPNSKTSSEPHLHNLCAREAGVNVGASPIGAIRRFSTAERANCVAARRGGEQAWSRTGRSQPQ